MLGEAESRRLSGGKQVDEIRYRVQRHFILEMARKNTLGSPLSKYEPE
jgi:hypothetical protein